MTPIEAYRKLKSELPETATFSIHTTICRFGKRNYGTPARTRLEYLIDVQGMGQHSQQSGDDLSAVVAMALDDVAPSSVNEDRIAEASAQAVQAIDVLQI